MPPMGTDAEAQEGVYCVGTWTVLSTNVTDGSMRPLKIDAPVFDPNCLTSFLQFKEPWPFKLT